MHPILSIDTSMETAAICVARGEVVLSRQTNNTQSDHARWIHTAIKDVLSECRIGIDDLKAVAVCEGPGSYTGLRVGMATAKGLCYALGIPLITESSLKLIAFRIRNELNTGSKYSYPLLIGPMVDARRMEVFTALYGADLQEKMNPAAVILDENSFRDVLERHIIIFCGNGSKKWQDLCKHENALFSESGFTIDDLAKMAFQKYEKQDFSDLAYSEPAYLKNFYTGNK